MLASLPYLFYLLVARTLTQVTSAVLLVGGHSRYDAHDLKLTSRLAEWLGRYSRQALNDGRFQCMIGEQPEIRRPPNMFVDAAMP